jgi:hypothetical protein
MRRALTLLAVLVGACASASAPSPAAVDFVVAVGDETFVLRLTDPGTIDLARERLHDANTRFPLGPLRAGDGGFNTPWSWHLDPAETRMVAVAIEVCDGTPSYVEAHPSEFPIYCPWNARITAER